jgi:hypothetical protein
MLVSSYFRTFLRLGRSEGFPGQVGYGQVSLKAAAFSKSLREGRLRFCFAILEPVETDAHDQPRGTSRKR